MQVEALYLKIQELLDDIYMKAGNMQMEQKALFREIDDRIEESSAFIAEETADWTAEDWKNLFFYYIKNGNLEVDRFVARKLKELCGPEFLRGCIRDHIASLANNVYSTGDKEALYESDVLLTAVKLLNRIKEGGADQEVSEAFSVCDGTNEHILYELAEYLCRECSDRVSALILDETMDENKLIALLSMFVSQQSKDETIYKAMKQRFKQLPDSSEVKSVFAAIFGDYGEPNAILLLRRYMKSLIAIYNQENGSQEIFSKIMMVSSVIEGLGGSAEDLMP